MEIIDLYRILRRLARAKGGSFSMLPVIEKLRGHSNFPSIYSLSETLTFFGFLNRPVQIKQAEDVSFVGNMLVYILSKRGRYLLLESIENGLVTYYEPGQKSIQSQKLTDLMQTWNGVGLIVDNNCVPAFHSKNIETGALILKTAFKIGLPVLALILFHQTLLERTLTEMFVISLNIILLVKLLNIYHAKQISSNFGMGLSCDNLFFHQTRQLVSSSDLWPIFILARAITLTIFGSKDLYPFLVVVDSSALIISLYYFVKIITDKHKRLSDIRIITSICSLNFAVTYFAFFTNHNKSGSIPENIPIYLAFTVLAYYLFKACRIRNISIKRNKQFIDSLKQRDIYIDVNFRAKTKLPYFPRNLTLPTINDNGASGDSVLLVLSFDKRVRPYLPVFNSLATVFSEIKFSIIFLTDSGYSEIHNLFPDMKSPFSPIGRVISEWVSRVKASGTMQQQLGLHRNWCELAELQESPAVFINGNRIGCVYCPNDLFPLLSHLSSHENHQLN
jgi:hypothetical protein